ncbi:MAG: hypothetical protein JSV17_01495 [Candidatus Aminicenantes bacterium]|nr:MAG: hypothetical protein JSV17_01495 [Candidatus Aminicenantes bacterium]
MKKAIFAVLAFIFLGSIITAYAQFTAEEISQREKIEELLKTADIIKAEEIGEGVTKPWQLFLRKGEEEVSGCWKSPQGIQKGHLEGWQYEIAAYQMDKLLGLNMIPPTVEREFEGKKGSLQMWIVVEFSLLEIMEQGIPLPDKNPEATVFNRGKYLARAFDSLIANEDRTQQNVLYNKDWRVILIDHSRSFRSKKKYQKRLLYGKNGSKEKQLFRQLPRSFVEKIKALDFDTIKSSVGPYLTDEEITAVLARKKLLLDEIEEMIEEMGQDKVLY